MKLPIKCIFQSFVPASIAGIITAFIALPYLWKLENKWGIELASQSTPSAMVIVGFIIFWLLFFMPFAYFSRRKTQKSNTSKN